MALSAGELLLGETVLLSKNANYRLDHGEALGGRVHLTSLRLVFEAHPVNRVVGRASIFLPTITGLEDSSRMLAKSITVITTGPRVELVVWGVPALIQRILAARDALPADTSRRVLAELVAKPGLLGAEAGFEAVAAVLREPGFDPRDGILPWPAHPLGCTSAVSAASLAVIA